MVNLLAAAALAAATPAAGQAAQQPAEPALFVVQNAGTTIYIFGTFHALDGKAEWLTPNVHDAFEESDELVLETLIPEKPADVVQSAPTIKPASLTASASFLATTKLAVNAGRANGMQVANGADMVLRHIAEAEDKPVEGLETLQLQINMFSHMPPVTPAVQPKSAAPAQTAKQMESLSRSMAAMQSAWKRGDQTIFVRMLDQLKTASPDTYRMMFIERNDRWADWIRARMQTPGTVFVAVGAGHLAGKDSLLVKLAQRGIPSRRVY